MRISKSQELGAIVKSVCTGITSKEGDLVAALKKCTIRKDVSSNEYSFMLDFRNNSLSKIPISLICFDYRPDDNSFYVGYVGTNGNFLRKGLATDAVNKMELIAKRLGCERIEFEANNNKLFWESVGYDIIYDDFYGKYL